MDSKQKSRFFLNDSAVIGFSMLVYMFSLNGVTLIFYIIASVLSGNGFSILPPPEGSVYFQTAEIAGYIISFLLTIFLMSRCFPNFANFSPPKPPYAALTLPVFLASFFILGYVGLFFEGFFERIGIRGIDVSIVAPKSGLGLILYIVEYTFLPAVLEEILFRGIILGRLRRFGNGFAVVFSSAVFALMHHNIVSMPNIFLLGALFGFITIASGSLVPAMVMHFANNAIAIFATYIEQHGAPISMETLSLILLFLELISLAAVAILAVILVIQRNQRRADPVSGYARSKVAIKYPARNRLAFGSVLSSGWMITFVILAVYTTLTLEFLPGILEQFTELMEKLGI